MTTEAKREAIARIIDPKAWEQRDYFAALLKGEDVSPDPALADMQKRSAARRIDTVVTASLAKADAIMALAEPQVPDDTVRIVGAGRDGKRVYLRRISAPEAENDGRGFGHVEVHHYDGRTSIESGGAAALFKAGRADLALDPASEPQALSEERAREVLAEHLGMGTQWLTGHVQLEASAVIAAMIRFATETQKGSGE